MLSAELKADADNTCGDLDYYFRISLKPDLVILFYYTLFWRKKRQTHHRKECELILSFDIMHCAQTTDYSVICKQITS